MTLCTYNCTEQGNRVETEYELVPLTMGQELVLPSSFIARPFTTVHTIASQVGLWGSACVTGRQARSRAASALGSMSL